MRVLEDSSVLKTLYLALMNPFNLLIIILFVGCRLLSAQDIDLKFKRYGGENGLSHERVTTVFKDSQGFVWVGTMDGVNRFDGYRFEQFTKVAFDTTSLPSKHIIGMVETKDSTIWLITNSIYLSKFEKKSHQFINYKLPVPPNTSETNFRPHVIALDRDQNLWMGLQNNGLLKFNSKTFESTIYHLGPDTIEKNLVTSIVPKAEGTLYVSTLGGGLALFDPQTQKTEWLQITRYKNQFENSSISNMFMDSDSTLWVLLWNGWIHKISKTGEFNKIQLTGSNRVAQPVHLVAYSAMSEDQNKRVWVATNHGIFLINKNGEVQKNFVGTGRENELNSTIVSSLCIDDFGFLMAGTLSGFYTATTHPPVFQSEDFSDFGLPVNIRALSEAPDSTLWVGSARYGIFQFKYDMTLGKFERIYQSEILKSTGVRALMVDSKNRVWLATVLKQIWILEGQTKQIIHKLADFPHLIPLYDHLIYTMYEDKKGNFWIGTDGDGVYVLTPNLVIKYHYKHDPNNINTISSNYIRKIVEDDDGYIWIGTENSGLNFLNPRTNQVIRFQYDPKNKSGLSSNLIWAIHTDKKDQVWVGTPDGLNKIDEYKHITIVSSEVGFSNQNMTEIVQDSFDNLWITTYSGLVKYSEKLNTVINYTKLDGLIGEMFNIGTAIRMKSGILVFGQPMGFIYQFEKQLNYQSENKGRVPLITGIEVMQEPIQTGIEYHLTNKIEIHSEFNYLTIYLSTLNFKNIPTTKYQYKLTGLFNEWISLGNENEIHLTGLKPGTYILTLRSQDQKGIWVESKNPYKLTVIPAWYQSTWFQIIYISVIIFLTIFFVRYRISQVQQEEKLRWQLAGDLHDEIGGSLSSIALRTEMMAKNSSVPENDKQQLNQMVEKARFIVNQIDDIIWAVKPKQDHAQDLIDRIKDIAIDMLNPHDISVSFHADDLPENLKFKPEAKKNIIYIFKESMNNVIKHSKADDVIISILSKPKEIHFVIKDNGIGFDVTFVTNRTGLYNLRRRASEIGGAIFLKSEKGHGTELKLVIDK